MNKPKVIHIISEFSPQGQFYIYDQFRNIENFEVHILTKCIINRKAYKNLKIHTIIKSKRLYQLILKICPRLFNLIAEKFFTYKIKKINPILIHIHFGHFAADFINIKKKLKMPLLVTFYGSDAALYPQIPAWKPRYKRLFQVGDKFLAICEDMKQKIVAAGCPKEKIAIWHIGIDLKKGFRYAERLPAKTTKFLIIARFIDKKGYFVLLDAFSSLLKERRDVFLTIVGYGRLKEHIVNFIRQQRLTNFIRLIDTEKENNFFEILTNTLYSHDIFLYPSIKAENGNEEGTPVCLMYAQAVGMPVITTNVGGIPETVIDGKTGYIIEPNDPKTLKEKMLFLMEHPHLWRELGANGRKHIERSFSLAVQIKKLEEIYKGFYSDI